MSSFFQAFPKELEEAGRIDGCSRLGVYAKIVLPLAKPALAALAIITFIYAWNDLFWPLIAITSDKTYTVQLGLTTFQGPPDGVVRRLGWDHGSRRPPCSWCSWSAKRFVQALTGAVKG